MPTKKKKKFKAKNQVEQGEILPCALQTTSKNLTLVSEYNVYEFAESFHWSSKFSLFKWVWYFFSTLKQMSLKNVDNCKSLAPG